MSGAKGIHSGHRDRVRQRFMTEGLSGFQPHQILELILFYCIPRRDTNELAHRLITRFGNLNGVFDADINELREFGLSEKSAAFIKLQRDLFDKLYYPYFNKDNDALTIDDAGDYFVNRYIGNYSDETSVLLLDPKSSMLYCGTVPNGSIETEEDVQKITRLAVMYKAGGVVLARNIPEGLLLPSKQDIMILRTVRHYLLRVGVELLDYILISGTDYLSLADSVQYGRFFF